MPIQPTPIDHTGGGRTRLVRRLTSLSLILAVALLLRIVFAWNYQHNKPEHALGTIPFLFEPGNIAFSLASGKGFSSPFRLDTGPTAWSSPVYPLLLAGVFRIFGIYTYQAFLAAVFLNVLFSTLTCVPVFFIAKRMGGLAVAGGAAWLWAVFPNAILLPFESLREASLSALLLAAVLWATLAVADSPRWRAWSGYGLLWGFALMTNATLAVLLPLLAGWAAYRGRRLAGPAAACAVALLCCVPWTVRNYLVFHSFIPLRSGFGLQLWMGNNGQPPGRNLGEFHPIYDPHERALYTQMGEIEYMRGKEREAIRFMLDHPGTELRLAASRFITIWTGGTPQPVADFVRSHSLRFRGVLIFNTLAALAAWLGMAALYRRRSMYAFPCSVCLLVFPVPFYLTLASARYRHPLDPVILLLAAVAFDTFRRAVKNPGPKPDAPLPA